MSEIKLPVRYKEDVMMIFDAEDQFVADFRLGFGHEQIVRLLNERATVEADNVRYKTALEKIANQGYPSHANSEKALRGWIDRNTDIAREVLEKTK